MCLRIVNVWHLHHLHWSTYRSNASITPSLFHFAGEGEGEGEGGEA